MVDEIMIKTRLLREGMREHDLADLVLPLISCDEYSSKIDSSEAIVMGFYVHDEAAAKDLNRFLQKSAVPLLGTDVSPAPDQHGYFMVFVEMMDNDRLAKNLEAILHEMSTLVDIEDWQLRVRENENLMGFTAENLMRGLEKAKRQSKKNEAIEYLRHSALGNAEFSDSLLILEGGGDRYCFDYIGFDRIDSLMQEFDLVEVGVKYDIRAVAKSNKISGMLGEEWDASRLGPYIMLHNEADPRGLLLKL
jgi:hypothetical protein